MFRFHSRIARAVVALGAASVLTLAGCAGGDSGSGSADGGSATSGTIQWWSWTPDNDLAEREIAAFNKQYPDIKVTYKKSPTTTTPPSSDPPWPPTTAPTSSRSRPAAPWDRSMCSAPTPKI